MGSKFQLPKLVSHLSFSVAPMFEYRCSSIDWKPSPVVALATSADGSQVAAAREDGSLEVWLVSPGASSWHCQLIIHGDPKSRISYLAWFDAGSTYKVLESDDQDCRFWRDLPRLQVLESFASCLCFRE